MFVTRKTYDAVVRERDEALALIAKMRRNAEISVNASNIVIAGHADTIRHLEGELRRAYVHDERGRIKRHPMNNGRRHP